MGAPKALQCPNCVVGELAPETGTCTACGWQSEGEHGLDGIVRAELGSQFEIGEAVARDPHSGIYVATRRDPEATLVLRVCLRAPIDEAGLGDRWWTVMAAVAACNHRHIQPIYRFGTTARLAWYATRVTGGRSLADLVTTDGPIGLDRCFRIIAQVASALEYAHRRDVVHGDLGPASVSFLDNNHRALVSDFAIGHVLAAVPSFTGRIRRNGVRAPEQRIVHKLTPAVDQYALAVLVTDCLTGELPVADGADPYARLTAAREDVPAPVLAALRRALSPRPSDRYGSVAEFAAALGAMPEQAARFVHPPPRKPDLAPRQPVVFPPDPPRAVSKPLGMIVAGAAILGMAAFAVARLMIDSNAPTFVDVPNVTQPAPASLPAASRLALVPDTSLVAGATPIAPADTAVIGPPATGRTAPPVLQPVDTRPAPAPPPPPRDRTEAREPARTTEAGAAERPARLPGRLFVSSRPWGQLYVDDQLLGNTPQADVPLTAGTHRMRIVREGFRTYQREIFIASGQELRIIDVVLEPTS